MDIALSKSPGDILYNVVLERGSSSVRNPRSLLTAPLQLDDLQLFIVVNVIMFITIPYPYESFTGERQCFGNERYDGDGNVLVPVVEKSARLSKIQTDTKMVVARDQLMRARTDLNQTIAHRSKLDDAIQAHFQVCEITRFSYYTVDARFALCPVTHTYNII